MTTTLLCCCSIYAFVLRPMWLGVTYEWRSIRQLSCISSIFTRNTYDWQQACNVWLKDGGFVFTNNRWRSKVKRFFESFFLILTLTVLVCCEDWSPIRAHLGHSLLPKTSLFASYLWFLPNIILSLKVSLTLLLCLLLVSWSCNEYIM